MSDQTQLLGQILDEIMELSSRIGKLEKEVKTVLENQKKAAHELQSINGQLINGQRTI